MIISELMGGLGNQMFQYTVGFSLAKHHHVSFKLDNLFLLDKSPRYYLFEYRPYELDIFSISAPLASPREIKQFKTPRLGNKYIYHLKKRLFKEKNVFDESQVKDIESLYSLPSNAYLTGYFQNYSLFSQYEQEIKQEFSFKNILGAHLSGLLEQIKQKDTLCIHIRRGDYVGHPILDVVSLDYYKKAFNILQEKTGLSRIFVFSDDINWCKENLKQEEFNSCPITFVDQEELKIDGKDSLQLMTYCNHFIIPNSTYSYWGAFLSNSTDKIIIAPKKWHKEQREELNAILPPYWITL